MEQIWKIEDMSCEHCVKRVTEGLSLLPGVTKVTVSLEDASAVLSCETPFTEAEAKVIVDELGYTFVGMAEK